MDEIESIDDGAEDVLEDIEDVTEPEVDTPEPDEPKESKPKESLEQKKARLQRELSRVDKKLGVTETKKPNVPQKQKTGELDETQLDYLDLKGISDEDEVALIQTVVAKTGQTVRQVLKDDYVQSKLETMRAKKAIKDATPSSTKRSGNQSGDLASALAKFESSGVLPDDFALRTEVVNTIASRSSANAPAWHK